MRLRPKSPRRPIIFAEDDEDDRLLICEALEEVAPDALVLFAEDGIELFSRLDQLEPEQPLPLLIVDLNMPRMSGREVLDRLRSDPVHGLAPVVVLSTSDAPSDIEAAYTLGASTFLTKPTAFRDLVETLESVLDYWLRIARLPQPSRPIHPSGPTLS